MNCDVNTLARSSSCLRCLTDAQLMLVKTFLFCKWAQNPKKQSGVAAPLITDFDVVDDGLGIWHADILKDPLPAGTNGMELDWQVNGGAFQVLIASGTFANNPINGLGPQLNFGDLLGVRARYVLNLVPVSPFSPTQTIVMGP